MSNLWHHFDKMFDHMDKMFDSMGDSFEGMQGRKTTLSKTKSTVQSDGVVVETTTVNGKKTVKVTVDGKEWAPREKDR